MFENVQKKLDLNFETMKNHIDWFQYIASTISTYKFYKLINE